MEHEQHAVALFLDPSLTLFDIAERCACTISELTQWVNSDAPQATLADLRALADFRVALIVAEALPDAARVLARLAAREPATPAQAETSRKAAGQLVRMSARGSAPSNPADPSGDPDDRDGPRDDGGLDDDSRLGHRPHDNPAGRSAPADHAPPDDLAQSAPTETDICRAPQDRSRRTAPPFTSRGERSRPSSGRAVRTPSQPRAARPLRRQVGACHETQALGPGSG